MRTLELLQNKNGVDVVAYENNGRYYFTSLENYNARIQDARKIQEVENCKDFNEFINYLNLCGLSNKGL